MILREVLGEALRNLRAHLLLSILTAMAVLLVAASAMAGSAQDVNAILEQQDALVLRGLNVWVVVPTDSSGDFSAQRCDELNGLAGIKAAGAVMATITSQPLAGPGVQVQYGTPRLANVYWPNTITNSGATVGARVGTDHGLGLRSTWAIQVGSTYLNIRTTTAPPTVRNSAWDGLVVIPKVPSGQTHTCWVEAASGQRDGVEGLLLGWWGKTNVKVSPLLQLDSTSISPQQELQGRLSQGFPIFGGILIVVLLMANWVIRRADFALYSLEGLRRSQLLWQVSVDVLILAYLPAIVAMSAVFTGAELLSTHGLTINILAMDAARILSLVLIGPPIALLVVGSRNAVSRLKGQ